MSPTFSDVSPPSCSPARGRFGRQHNSCLWTGVDCISIVATAVPARYRVLTPQWLCAADGWRVGTRVGVINGAVRSGSGASTRQKDTD
jgi:hypothetical protein